ncbi:MAG: TetR/AcrR family transcriptional regulator [Pseudomonadota bacterium]
MISKATLLFNERGISGTSLSHLAEDLGIARASVYHYIESRDELVFQCYQAACETSSRDLDAAEKAGNGFEQIMEFVRLTLTPDRPPVAVLTEVNSLNPAIASIICDQNNSNIARLVNILETGEKDGSIRTNDATISSQSIGGMLAWAQLLPLWTFKRRDAEIRERATETLIEILTHGLSVDRSTPFETHLLAADCEDQFTNIFDPEQAAAMKYQMVLKTASILFNQNGVEATSIDQIADRIGVTKGVLYHYFDDKSDLIKQCYERSFVLYDRFIQAAEGVEGNALDILQTNTHLNIQAQTSRIAPLMPQPGFGSLPEKTRKRLTLKARDQNQALGKMLDQAIEDGIARPYQSGLVTHICAGAIGWIPKWLPENNTYKPFEIADKISDMFRFGLKAE